MKLKITIIIMTFLFLTTGCSKEDNQSINYKPSKFIDKVAFKEKEDGWVSYLYIEVGKKDINSFDMAGNCDMDEIYAVFYDSVNLKYSKLDGYYIPVIDSSGKESDKITSVMPSLARSEHRDEVSDLNKYLSEKKFKDDITIADLDDAPCENLDKNEIVELYNQALKKEPKGYPNGLTYSINKERNSFTKNLSNGGVLQVSYILEQVRIGVLNIEYIDPNGDYLSDLIVSEDATSEQIQAQKTIDNIEASILEKQTIEVSEDIESIPDFKTNLNQLLRDALKKQEIK